jgi:cytochrome c oxidase subunit 2
VPAACAAASVACWDHQDALLPQGPQARSISVLWWQYLAITSLVALLVITFVAIAIWRHGKPEDANPGEPRLSREAAPPLGTAARALRYLDATSERRKLQVVVAATVLTVVVLFVLLVSSITTGSYLARLDPRGAPWIEVTGAQWWWRVRYHDAVASNTFETANEIHVPVGKPVLLQLKASDVIHSFWVPNLHGKLDLIPGQDNRMLIQADRPGTFKGQCAEFCGLGHARMSLLVIAQPPERFEAWRAHQRKPARAPQNATEMRGQEVFLNGPCVMCHAITGTPASSHAGPDLTHVASRKTLGAGTLPNRRGHLAGWILNAQSIKPGNHMPNVSLPPDDLQALLSYLESLR